MATFQLFIFQSREQWHTLVMHYFIWTSGTPVAHPGDALLYMDQWHTLVMRYCIWTSGTPW